MSMSPRELAIMRLQRSVTPPSLLGAAQPFNRRLKRQNEAVREAVETMGPAIPTPPPKEKEWYDSTAYKVGMWASSVGAMALSYQRNESIPWALAHGIIGPVYLAYRGVQAVSDRKS